jgi:hypothetical protein
MINVLENSTKNTITKPYAERDKTRDDVGAIDTILDYYTDEAIIKNAKRYYTNYPIEYQKLLNQNFESLKSELSYLHTKFLVIVIDVENIRAGIGGGWCIRQFWLENDRDELRIEFHQANDTELPEDIHQHRDTLEYDGEEYQVVARSASSDHKIINTMRHNNPVFEDIHKRINNDLESYLRQKEADIIPSAMR